MVLFINNLNIIQEYLIQHSGGTNDPLRWVKVPGITLIKRRGGRVTIIHLTCDRHRLV